MELFDKQLRRRDAADRALERDADEALEENRQAVYSDGAQEALRTLMKWIDVDAAEVLDVDDVDELLECMLSPKGVMYEEVDMHDDAWKSRSEFMLAQREDGAYLACKPDIFGYAYSCPSADDFGHIFRFDAGIDGAFRENRHVGAETFCTDTQAAAGQDADLIGQSRHLDLGFEFCLEAVMSGHDPAVLIAANHYITTKHMLTSRFSLIRL